VNIGPVHSEVTGSKGTVKTKEEAAAAAEYIARSTGSPGGLNYTTTHHFNDFSRVAIQSVERKRVFVHV